MLPPAMRATPTATKSRIDPLIRAFLLLPLALAACGRTDDDASGRDGVTPAEARQLDEAAKAIDINTTTANATETPQ